jgi:hypothetical protein
VIREEARRKTFCSKVEGNVKALLLQLCYRLDRFLLNVKGFRLVYVNQVVFERSEVQQAKGFLKYGKLLCDYIKHAESLPSLWRPDRDGHELACGFPDRRSSAPPQIELPFIVRLEVTATAQGTTHGDLIQIVVNQPVNVIRRTGLLVVVAKAPGIGEGECHLCGV